MKCKYNILCEMQEWEKLRLQLWNAVQHFLNEITLFVSAPPHEFALPHRQYELLSLNDIFISCFLLHFFCKGITPFCWYNSTASFSVTNLLDKLMKLNSSFDILLVVLVKTNTRLHSSSGKNKHVCQQTKMQRRQAYRYAVTIIETCDTFHWLKISENVDP